MFYNSPEWFEASLVILAVARTAEDISIRIDLNWSMNCSLTVPPVLTMTLKGCSDAESMTEHLQEGIGSDPVYEGFEIEIEDGEIKFHGWWENGEATCEAIVERFSEYTLEDWHYKTSELSARLSRALEEQHFIERARFELVNRLKKKIYRGLDRGTRKVEFLSHAKPQKAAEVQAEIRVYETLLDLIEQTEEEYIRNTEELTRGWHKTPCLE
jgi:hypothetical protein